MWLLQHVGVRFELVALAGHVGVEHRLEGLAGADAALGPLGGRAITHYRSAAFQRWRRRSQLQLTFGSPVCRPCVPAVTPRPRLWRKDAPSRGRGSGWNGTALMGEVPNCRHCPSRARGKNVQPGVANIREREISITALRARGKMSTMFVIKFNPGVGGGFCF